MGEAGTGGGLWAVLIHCFKGSAGLLMYSTASPGDTYYPVFQRGKVKLREEGKAYKLTQPRKMLALPAFWGQKSDPSKAWDAGGWFMYKSRGSGSCGEQGQPGCTNTCRPLFQHRDHV